MKKIASICLALFLVGIGAIGAEERITIYGLKGSSGVGMVRLFESPPVITGTSVTVEALGGADLMVAKFVSGEAKLGILPPNIAAKLAAAGRPIQVAAVVGEGMLKLLSSDPTIRSIADLRGKVVKVAGQGATPDYVFRKILDANGLDVEKDVSLDYSMAYPEMAQALIAGRVPCALLPEPFATMALQGSPSLSNVVDVQAEWARVGGAPSYPMTVFVVDADFAQEHRAALKVIVEAYRSSIQWVLSNPTEAGELVEKHGLGLKAAVAKAAIPKSSYVFIPAVQARPALEALYRLFLEVAPASIGGHLPADSFYLNL